MLRNWRNKLRLKRFIKEANRLHASTRKQYFVVPVGKSEDCKYSLTSAELHKKYNKTAKKIGRPTISYKQLLEIAVYKTKAGVL